MKAAPRRHVSGILGIYFASVTKSQPEGANPGEASGRGRRELEQKEFKQTQPERGQHVTEGEDRLAREQDRIYD